MMMMMICVAVRREWKCISIHRRVVPSREWLCCRHCSLRECFLWWTNSLSTPHLQTLVLTPAYSKLNSESYRLESKWSLYCPEHTNTQPVTCKRKSLWGWYDYMVIGLCVCVCVCVCYLRSGCDGGVGEANIWWPCHIAYPIRVSFQSRLQLPSASMSWINSNYQSVQYTYTYTYTYTFTLSLSLLTVFFLV
jgi:hypothetical protein